MGGGGGREQPGSISAQRSGTKRCPPRRPQGRMSSVFGTRSVESVRGTVLLADITKQPSGSFIFGADTVALGPVGFNSVRASVALASPTSGHFSASLLSQSGVQTDLAGNLTRSKDTTVVRLDSAAVVGESGNRYPLQSPGRVCFSKGFLALE